MKEKKRLESLVNREDENLEGVAVKIYLESFTFQFKLVLLQIIRHKLQNQSKTNWGHSCMTV